MMHIKCGIGVNSRLLDSLASHGYVQKGNDGRRNVKAIAFPGRRKIGGPAPAVIQTLFPAACASKAAKPPRAQDVEKWALTGIVRNDAADYSQLMKPACGE